MKKSIACLFFLILISGATWAANQTRLSTQALIERVTPGYSSQFDLEMIESENGKDVYEVDACNKRICLRGNNAVALASAFNWYLKHSCQAHVSWFGNQLSLPAQLPVPKEKTRIVVDARWRVYMNYCTVSYSAAWWDWKRWEKEIDFMAMNGINMPLSVVGLEAVWYNTLRKFKFSDSEARAFLASPAHSAWQWMQNLQSYNGPLPKSWINSHARLGKQIMQRQIELGMHPIQQGFSGFVPKELKDKFPQASIRLQNSWCGFPGAAQLDPTDPLFKEMGLTFLQEQKKLFGAYGNYAADPFHESIPPINTPEYLRSVGKSIHDLFKLFDPQSTWIMQAWSLRDDIVKAIPQSDLLILDLNGAKCKSKEYYWGYSFVVGNLHNFGGRINMHGDLALLASNQYEEMKKVAPHVCGVGLFMEGINQNPVYYELAFDMMQRSGKVDLIRWLPQYATRRYGVQSDHATKAWQLLLKGPYAQGTNGTEFSSMVAARPALVPKKSGPNAGFTIPYNPLLLFQVQELLLKDKEKMSASVPYRFDVVDVQRQLMSNLAQEMHREAIVAYQKKDVKIFRLHADRFLTLLNDLDLLLSTRPEYSLQQWLSDARGWGKNKAEADLFERDATSLVTIWGPDEPIIFDYSWREWSGLVGNYYLPRWRMFYDHIQHHLAQTGILYSDSGLTQVHGRETFRANDFYNQLADWEKSFVTQFDKKMIPMRSGEEMMIASRLFEKYKPFAVEYYASRKISDRIDDGELKYENLGE